MAALSNVLRGAGVTGMLRPVFAGLGNITRRHLPICTVDTNLSPSQLPDNFSIQFSQHVAELLNKPSKLVTVTVRSGLDMCRDSSSQPAVSIHIWSVGVFDKERNPAYSQATFKFLLSKLNVSEERVTILFHPIEKNDAGHLLYADMKK